MSFTRFHDDPCRIKKQLQESTGIGKYMLNVPGTGDKPCFMEDPYIRLKQWGANLRTNTINLESDLIGLSRPNTKDCIDKKYIKKGENPLQVAANQLVKDGITILHTIGGDDTNTTAADLSKFLKKNNYNLTVVGMPKTIDNDVYPITQTLGAWTAAEQGAIFFENIVNENTTSNRQLIIHEVMGRHCGWLTAATALEYRERLMNKKIIKNGSELS